MQNTVNPAFAQVAEVIAARADEGESSSQSIEIAKALNSKANELKQSALELLRVRDGIERKNSADVSRKLMNSIDADMRLNVLKTVLSIRSIRQESADKVRVTIRHADEKAVLAAIDKAIIEEFELMSAYRLNYVKALKTIKSTSSENLLNAELQKMKAEKEELEKALVSEERVMTLFKITGVLGVGVAFFSVVHTKYVVEKDIELAKKRIEFMAEEQARVDAELRQLLLTNP